MNNYKRFFNFKLLLFVSLLLVTSFQTYGSDVFTETDNNYIFYYRKDAIFRENMTFSHFCNFPSESREDVAEQEQSCDFNPTTACKREGQYHVGFRGDGKEPSINCNGAYNCSGNARMIYNVKAHFVNYDENEIHCSFESAVDCGVGIWDPNASGSHDQCPPDAPTCYSKGTCCGDDPDDDPDMGLAACLNCSLGFNARDANDFDSPYFRKYRPDHLSDSHIAQTIACCGDDMVDDCMLIGSNNDYTCFNIRGVRTQTTQPAPTPIPGCDPDPFCDPYSSNCCETIVGAEDPALTRPPPYNTSSAYWYWGDTGTFKGHIANVTCANYQILAAEEGWISCNDFIINRDVTGRPNNELYFTLSSGDGGQSNPKTITAVDGTPHDYLCYTEDEDNYSIAECCGHDPPTCLSDGRRGGVQKGTGDIITSVKNSDFKRGTGANATFWTISKNHRWTGSLIEFYNYTHQIDQFTVSDPINVTPNTDYSLSAFVYNDLETGSATITVSNLDDSIACQVESLFGLEAWEPLSCDFTTTASTTQLKIKLITNGGATGEARFKDIHLNTIYCTDDFRFTSDLDGKSEDSCNNANHEPTGQYCCSEDDDANEFYNDPGTVGACWNKVYQPQSGPYVVYPEGGKQISEVIVFNGTFFGCSVDNSHANFNPTADSNKPYEGSINFIRHGDFNVFSTGEDISKYFQSFATVDASISNAGIPYGKVLVLEAESLEDHISQKQIQLTNGESYTIIFEAKATYNITIPSYSILRLQSGMGIINCDEFIVEPDWKTFKCSGTWTDNEPGVFILNSTGTPTNNIYYDNIRIYSSNEFILDLRDHPNPGGDGIDQGILITDVSYCTIFDFTPDDYFCSYREIWMPTDGEDRSVISYIPWDPKDPNTQKAECCGEDSCWNGKECIGDQSKNPHSQSYPDGGDGYRCIGGEWTNSTFKYDWNGRVQGYCPEQTQCLVNPDGNSSVNGQPETYSHIDSGQEYPSDSAPQCINDTQYILDHYCDGGSWTSRTKLLAEDILELAVGMGLTNYTLFCEDYANALNIYTYSAPPLFGEAVDLLDGTDCKIYPSFHSGSEQVSCVNKICILKYYESGSEHAIFGTTINTPINATLDTPHSTIPYRNPYLLEMFGKPTPIYPNPTYCQDETIADGTYRRCSSDNNIWYNHKKRSLLYNKQGISSISMSSNPLLRFFKTIFDFIQFWNPRNPIEPSLGAIPFGFLNQTKDFNKIYIDIKPNTLILGIREKVWDVNDRDYVDFLAINYTGFSPNLCDSVLQLTYRYGTAREVLLCNRSESNNYYVTSKSIEHFEDQNHEIWKQLTSQLRVK